MRTPYPDKGLYACSFSPQEYVWPKNVLQCIRMFWNVYECNRMYWNVLECIEMYFSALVYPNVYVAHFVRNMILFGDFQTLCSGSVNQLTICYFRNLSWEKILYKIYYSWLSILPAKYWKTWGKSAKFVWKKIVIFFLVKVLSIFKHHVCWLRALFQ